MRLKKKISRKKTPTKNGSNRRQRRRKIYTRAGKRVPEKYNRVTTAADNKLSDDWK